MWQHTADKDAVEAFRANWSGTVPSPQDQARAIVALASLREAVGAGLGPNFVLEPAPELTYPEALLQACEADPAQAERLLWFIRVAHPRTVAALLWYERITACVHDSYRAAFERLAIQKRLGRLLDPPEE